MRLDRGSIRSSPRYGLSTPYRLTKEQCWTVPPCSYLHGVRPALGPSSRCPPKFFFDEQVGGTLLSKFYSLGFVVGPLLPCLKVIGWGGVGW